MFPRGNTSTFTLRWMTERRSRVRADCPAAPGSRLEKRTGFPELFGFQNFQGRTWLCLLVTRAP